MIVESVLTKSSMKLVDSDKKTAFTYGAVNPDATTDELVEFSAGIAEIVEPGPFTIFNTKRYALTAIS